MNKLYFYAFLFLVFSLSSGSIWGQRQKPIRIKGNIPMIYCPASEKVGNHYTPERKRSSNKMTETVVNINYIGGVPQPAKLAFEGGVVEIIKNLFDTPAPINVELNWAQLEDGQLAGAQPGAYYSGFSLLPDPEAVYPVALAEKIARGQFTGPDDPDVIISVNSNVDWYYQYTNPGGIGNKFDFVSILLHEVMHGLGFTAAVGITEDTPALGFVRLWNNDAVSIYTDFMTNQSNTPLTQVPDGTTQMAGVLQSNNLFFNLITRGERVKLYAPTTWDPGSSVSHVDENTFNNTNSSLMTPFSGRGDVERDPGVALDMMYDMGWDMTYLLHVPPSAGNENFDEAQLLEMLLISDSPVDSSSVKIHYSTDGFVAEDIEADMTINPTNGIYEFTLPAPGEPRSYSYYFTASNNRKVKFTNPGKAPVNVYDYTYSIDATKPVMNHDRITSVNTATQKVDVLAEITDFFTGIEKAEIEWSINDVAQPPIQMERQTGFQETDTTDNYKASIIFPNGPLLAGDVFKYRIVTNDKSLAKNQTILPFAGFYSITVEQVKETVSSYVNDFNVATTDFEGVGFAINRAAGFANNAINSPHPYPEAGDGNFRNFTYDLKIPIVIAEEDPLIEFDEIVIVEPGEPGTRFGDDEFWDYVIVEGKVVGTEEWVPFLDGYDCISDPIWRSAYDNGANGNPSMYRPRVINMTTRGNFAAGDEVFIRFRLFSDPFSNGWGWAVDNLRIQAVNTAVEDFINKESFELFPNPNHDGLVTLAVDLVEQTKSLQVEVIDMFGRIVDYQRISGMTKSLRHPLDLSGLNQGMYLVNLRFEDGSRISRKLMIQKP